MKRFFLRFGKTLVLLVLLLLIVPPVIHPKGIDSKAGLSPSIQVYGANVWGVRGYFAIHTWIATRAAGESQYTIQEVIGWRIRRTGTALTQTVGPPNRAWFGNEAILLHEVNGVEASSLIPRVREAVNRYPFASQYTMFPGPNSNSFTEWVAQEVPELELALPAKAIGRLWMRHHYQQLVAP